MDEIFNEKIAQDVLLAKFDEKINSEDHEDAFYILKTAILFDESNLHTFIGNIQEEELKSGFVDYIKTKDKYLYDDLGEEMEDDDDEEDNNVDDEFTNLIKNGDYIEAIELFVKNQELVAYVNDDHTEFVELLRLHEPDIANFFFTPEYSEDEDSSSDLDISQIDSNLGAMSPNSRRNRGSVCKITNNGSENIIEIIPSTWRMETFQGAKQGDHITAYVLLLESLTHIKEKSINELPEKFYEFAKAILPEKHNIFLFHKNNIEKKTNEMNGAYKFICKKLKGNNNSLIEIFRELYVRAIMRHIEDVCDIFIREINSLEDAVCPSDRKKGMRKTIVNRLKKNIENPNFSVSEKREIYEKLNNSVKNKEDGNFTVDELNKISKKLLDITPMRKYHEGTAIKKIRDLLEKKTLDFPEIGKTIAKLYDYPKVENMAYNDVNRLCKTLARHLVINFMTFYKLLGLQVQSKKEICCHCVDHILYFQLWDEYDIGGRFLDRNSLIHGIRQYADFNDGGILVMK